MSLNYTKKTINHFLEPKNIGEIKKPDGYAQIGNMVCGDQLDFFIKVEKGKIKDVKFLSFGCASNIATASVLTERVKGMTIEKAKAYNWKKVVEELGGLPEQKIHCSIMAVEGLQKAISDYENREAFNEDILGRAAKKSKKAAVKKTTRKTISQRGAAVKKSAAKTAAKKK